MSTVDSRQQPPAGSFADYVAIARLDHATKHVLIVPGAVFAYLLRGVHADSLALGVVLGLGCAVCMASANYVINEWLDRDFDKFHPTKSQRAAVQKTLRGGYVVLEWAILVAAGLALAWWGGALMLLAAVIFGLQGIVYNVPPLRTKDKPYLDVISESINNPVRLMLGWAMVDPTTLPPSSIILLYWAGGAFLMTAKRLSEYREITASHGHELLARYRASFAGYTEIRLTVCCFAYALASTFLLAVFLMKYRIEYLLTAPVVILLFGWYLGLSMRPGSSAQKPEKLFRERGLMVLVALLGALFLLLTFVDIPLLEPLAGQHYISIQ
jgi:4-hydroxybenzoate polyprenyltransferase